MQMHGWGTAAKEDLLGKAPQCSLSWTTGWSSSTSQWWTLREWPNDTVCWTWCVWDDCLVSRCPVSGDAILTPVRSYCVFATRERTGSFFLGEARRHNFCMVYGLCLNNSPLPLLKAVIKNIQKGVAVSISYVWINCVRPDLVHRSVLGFLYQTRRPTGQLQKSFVYDSVLLPIQEITKCVNESQLG